MVKGRRLGKGRHKHGRGSSHVRSPNLIDVELMHAIFDDTAVVLHDVHVGESECLLRLLFGYGKKNLKLLQDTVPILMPSQGREGPIPAGSYPN